MITMRLGAFFVLLLIFLLCSQLDAQSPAAIAKQLQQDLTAGYGKTIASVTVQQRQLRIRLSEPKVTENIYTAMLPIICAHLGARATQFSEIVVVNRFDAQGYVYEQPAKCEAIARRP